LKKPPRGGFVLAELDAAQGLLVALSNPKTLLFFGAFFPQTHRRASVQPVNG
jgi:threonine/homoserine/homoserine lactone efflux protein